MTSCCCLSSPSLSFCHPKPLSTLHKRDSERRALYLNKDTGSEAKGREKETKLQSKITCTANSCIKIDRGDIL